ncbi:VWA domain-containing protein [bacterium]|nr:VWA domain-containing protein [bacterium]
MIIRFANPLYLLLLSVIPLAVLWRLKWRARRAALKFSNIGVIKEVGKKKVFPVKELFFWLKLFIITLLIIAFARPQSGVKGEEVITQGIDIVLAIDVSSSMLAEDIKPNRIEAAKQVAADFIKGRKHDRIGLVVFAAQGYTQCPLTIDYSVLLNFLDNLKTGMIEDGTAIGMGLATAINRLRTSQAKSKIIILLTDGRNNRGEIDPLTAAQAANALNIKIYTVGAGTRGTAMYPVNDPLFGKRYVPMKVDIDESTLMRIADITGASYFRATNTEQLKKVYHEIDKMEKTKIEVKEYTRYSELFYFFAGAALFLLLAVVVLENTRFRSIP